MMTELSMLVKATAILILALLAARLGSRQSAAVRSLMLACAFGLLLLVPIASLMLPVRAIELPARQSLPFARESFTGLAPVDTSSVPADIAQDPPSRFGMPSMRAVLLLLWAVVATAFVTPLVAGLFRVRRTRAHGRPWVHPAFPARVDVVLHDEVRVPNTFGVLRPVIALPVDAPQWPQPDLRRVLLHELEHVRRRDWPVHMTARVICALYWFHPLAWIAWRRLCLESERACDDAVLREEDGAAYAEQLVLLARRITKDDALPLLSIAGRSHLSTRVAAMLARNVARGRVRSATAVAAAAVAAVAALGIGPLRLAEARSGLALQAVTASPQSSPQSSSSALAFSSTSIRRTNPSTTQKSYVGRVNYSADGRVSAANVDLVDLIVSAYDLYRWQVVDAPKWADAWEWEKADRFDVQATARRGASRNDLRQMLRTVLADRFRLTVRPENRVQKVYELVVEPAGHKLQPPGETKYVASEDIWMKVDPKTMIATLSVEQMTMAQLVRNLGFPMLTRVFDRTGLEEAYRVTARWNATPGSREIFEAFPAQLGLRFREATGPVEYLVIDRAEQPKLRP